MFTIRHGGWTLIGGLDSGGFARSRQIKSKASQSHSKL